MRRIVFTLGLVGLGLAQGCNGNDDTEETDADCADVTFEAGAVAGAGTVTFPGTAGEAWVEHKLDDGEEHDWIAGPKVDGSTGTAPVWGLRTGADHLLRVQLEGGASASCEIAVETDPPPEGTPAFTPVDQASWATDKACAGVEDGYVLLSFLGQNKSGVGIVDRDGKYVWAIANDEGTPWGVADTLIGRARPGRDGRSVLWNVAHEDRVDDVAEIVRLSLDGSEVTHTRTLNGHHDFVELPDGTMSWLGYDFRTMVVDGLGDEAVPVAADTLYEGPEGATDTSQTVEVFNTFDDYPYGIFLTEEMENCVTGFLPGYCEFSHGNSLAYLPGSDTYLVNFRWVDAMFKLTRQGGWVWQWGGQHPGGAMTSDFTGDNSTLFSHPHFSDVWETGLPNAPHTQLLMMDNHDIDPPSRLAGYDLDETAMTFERTYMWQSDKFESLLGDVRRFPIEGCDNVLVAFSSQGRIAEMTREGEIVWDMGYGLGNVVARIQYLPTLVDFDAYPNQEL